jgi:hypothetical protein
LFSWEFSYLWGKLERGLAGVANKMTNKIGYKVSKMTKDSEKGGQYVRE